jgi:hypothetical protein
MNMPGRDAIHILVDNLPESALEAAERILRSSQTWKPPFRQSVAQMRRNVRMRMSKDPGVPAMEHPGNRRTPPIPLNTGSNRFASGIAWEDDTFVTFRICRRQWHELEIEERLRISEDKARLTYSQHVQGPGGKVERFEIKFPCR